MSSVGAGPAALRSPEEISGGWRTGLAAVEHIHHQAGNFVVALAGDEAEAFCYGIAYHYRARVDGRNTRVFVGSYDFRLTREAGGAVPSWRITSMRFALKFLDGNPTLPGRLTNRCSCRNGPSGNVASTTPKGPFRS
jgi:hypothetical protein